MGIGDNMVMFGYFVTLSLLFDEVTIKFHLRGGGRKLMADMYEMSTKALKLTFNDKLKLNGSFDRIYISEKMVTVEIKIKLRDGIIGMLVDEMRGKDIRIEAIVDLLEEKAKPVNQKFLSMCIGRVKKFAELTGYTMEEMKVVLNVAYSELCGIAFEIDSAKPEELESFYSYLGQRLMNGGMEITERIKEPGGIDGFLSGCRDRRKCCECGSPSIEIIGKYPLCKKHLDKFNVLKKTYPKSYMKRYEEMHHFSSRKK